jgi:hypothetical protein
MLKGDTIDFSRKPSIYLLKNADELEQHYNYIFDPSMEKPTLRLDWNCVKKSWMQVSIKETERIELPDKNTVKVTINGHCNGPCSAIFLNLRLVDAKGEVFQYRRSTHWRKKGKWSLDYVVQPDNLKKVGSWGGDKDKKMDKPVSLLGFSIEFKENSGKGEIYVDSINIDSSPGGKTEYREVTGNMYDYLLDSTAIAAIRPNNAKVEAHDEQIKLVWQKLSGNSLGFNFCSWEMGSCCTAPKLPKFRKAVFNIGCITEAQIKKVSIYMVDKKGKYYWFHKAVNQPRLKTTEIALTISEEDITKKKIEQPLRFAGISFYAGKGSSGHMVVDRLGFSLTMDVTDAIKMDLQTGSPVHVLKAGNEKNLMIQLQNVLDKKLRVNTELWISDFDGNTKVKFPKKVYDFNPGQTISIPVKSLGKYGIYYVNCKISVPEDSKDSRMLVRSFAYMKPAKQSLDIRMPEGFVMGINSHPERSPSEVEREAMAIFLAGGRLVRTTFGTPNNFQVWDKIVEIFSRYGINFDFIIGYVKKNRKDTSPDYEKSRQAYRRIFKRYKGKVRYWELLNEPDIQRHAPSAQDYIRLARIAKEELKEIAPDAKLLSAGFCAFDYPERGKFQRDVMVQTGEIFDLHCFHGHAPFELYSQVTIDKLLMPMRKANNITLPWYSNETALTSANRSEKEQAENLFKKVLFARSRGTVGYNWYNLRNKGENLHSNEHNYGMFTMDFYPKAVYQVFNTIAEEFRDSKFVQQLPLPDGFHVYEFKSDKGVTFGSWSENYSQLQVLLKTDADKAELIDLMGNVSPASSLGDLIIIPCSEKPVILRLRGVSKVEAMPSAVSLILPGFLMPGGSYPLKCQFYNPLPQAKSFSFTLSSPTFVKIANKSGTVEVGPSKFVEWNTTLTVDDDYVIDSGELVKIMMEYRLDRGEPTNFVQSVNAAQPFESHLDGKPLFELDQKNQIIALYDLDPVNLHMQWQSSDDLSAKIWMKANEQSLSIRIDVKDDVHYQTFGDRDCHEGDSVQITLKTKDMAFPCEVNFYHKDGQDYVVIPYTPPGLDINNTKAAKEIGFKFTRTGKISKYLISIPYKALKINRKSLFRDGFRYNTLVNDNDGHGRKGWCRLAPGIGRGIIYTDHPLLIPEISNEVDCTQ